MKRREFLAAGAAGIAALWAPQFAFAQAASGYRRLLILVELKGGNDGLNTVIPYADDSYYSLRPRLREVAMLARSRRVEVMILSVTR